MFKCSKIRLVTLVQSEIWSNRYSIVTIFVIKRIFITFNDVVGCVISNESGLEIKLKFSTVDIQIKQSGLRISNSKVFSSGDIYIYIYIFYIRVLYRYCSWPLCSPYCQVDDGPHARECSLFQIHSPRYKLQNFRCRN